jgi:hypothetical protein
MRAAFQDAGAGTRKYEDDPGVITVKQAEHVRIIITALDHDHGQFRNR